jgi:hypothetical protein
MCLIDGIHHSHYDERMTDDAPIFAYEAQNFQTGYGGRVFADGRYELYDNWQPGAGEPQWETFDPFTPEQITQITAAVDKASAANLPDHVETSVPPAPDAGVAKVTLGGRQIVIDEWPQGALTEINAIMDLITEFRKPEA